MNALKRLLSMQPTSFVGLCISTGGITAPLAKIGDIGRLPFLLYTLAEDQKFFGISPYRRNITGSLPFPVCRTSLLRKHAQHIWRDINEAVARNLSNGLVVYPFSANASAKKTDASDTVAGEMVWTIQRLPKIFK